jgi:HK97 family phage major capsid protein
MNPIGMALELARLLRPSWQTLSASIPPGTPTCEVAEAPLKDKLKEIETELATARDERAAAVKARDKAREEFAASDSLSQDSDEFKAAQEAVRALGEIDDRIAGLQSVQVTTLKMLGETDSAIAENFGVDRSRRKGSDAADGWDSSGIFAREGLNAQLEQLSATKARFGTVQLGEAASREAMAADIAPTSEMRRGQYYGLLPQLTRPLRVLDLIPTGTMDGNSFPYTQESGSLTGAVETAEGDPKSEVGVTYTDATATAETIAGWMKIRKQALSDVPALRTVIDNRLRYIVRRRLENQVLAGDGTGSNLEGILEVPGTNSVTFDAAELAGDQVLRGITEILLAEGEASGIVMNPTDWQDVLIQKATGGNEQYYSGGPFHATPQVMWGVPLVPSQAIPAGTALVGDWDLGAMLFIREGVNVLLSDSDQDDFLRNRVTLLGEMRAAFPIWRPEAFTLVELVAP